MMCYYLNVHFQGQSVKFWHILKSFVGSLCVEILFYILVKRLLLNLLNNYSYTNVLTSYK